MIKFDKTMYSLNGSYPKNPALRQSRRSLDNPGTNYMHVDLAMTEPVRIINEELSIRTLACCEYHPCDLDKRQYETFQYKGRECNDPYRGTYRSFIVLDLRKDNKVASFRDFIKKKGFVDDSDISPHGGFDMIDVDDENSRVLVYRGLKAEFCKGILGLRYAFNAANEPIDNKYVLDVTPLKRAHIRQWKEWDCIRDTGWEYWLEILHLYTKEGA